MFRFCSLMIVACQRPFHHGSTLWKPKHLRMYTFFPIRIEFVRMNLYRFLDLILVLDEALAGFEVSLDHLLDETREIDLTLPAKEPFSFSRITEKKAEEKKSLRRKV